MRDGIVTWFNSFRGYGFAECDGQRIFIHHSNIINNDKINKGDKIQFKITNGELGPMAMYIAKQ